MAASSMLIYFIYRILIGKWGLLSRCHRHRQYRRRLKFGVEQHQQLTWDTSFGGGDDEDNDAATVEEKGMERGNK